jgi:hypothetical protein
MNLAQCYCSHVFITLGCSCPMTRIMTTSEPQTPNGDPFIGSLYECIQLDAIRHVEFHLKHLESLVHRRLHRGTYTLYVDVPYLPYFAAQFLWR